MKKMFLLLPLLLSSIVNANEDSTSKFNAYTQDIFVKIEIVAYSHEELSSQLDISLNDYNSESSGKQSIGITAGIEFPVSIENNFYSDTGVAYINKGASHTAQFFGHVIYKKNSWKFYAGGYFGTGIDKLRIDHITVSAPNKNAVTFDVDKTPSYFCTGFDIGTSYILNKHWTIDVKFQSDEKSYDSLSVDTQSMGINGSTTLSMLAAQEADINIVSTNLIVGVSYSF